MTFEIATMLWDTKETTVIHKKYSISKELPWTIDPAKCLHGGLEHNFKRSAWTFSNYNTRPVGSANPKGMSALLRLSLSGLTEEEKRELEQHFIEERQLSLTVYFNQLLPETLLLNLRTK
jgi:hypothetical protein